MKRSYKKNAVSIILIFAFANSFIVPALASPKKDTAKVNVAFLGVHYDNVPKDVEKRFQARLVGLLKDESSFNLSMTGKALESLDQDQVNSLLLEANTENCKLVADQLHVDYLYFGNISDRSKNEGRVLLVGELNRYDRKTNLLHRFEIAKYHDVIGVEFLRFEKEYIDTIIPELQNKKTTWPWIVVAGVGVAGLIALTLSTSRLGGDSNGENPDNPMPTTPIETLRK